MTRMVLAILMLVTLMCPAFGQYPVQYGPVQYGPVQYGPPQYVQPVKKKKQKPVYQQEVYNEPSHEVHEVVHEVAAPIAVPVLVPATVFQYLPALTAPGTVGTPTMATSTSTTAAQPQVQNPATAQQDIDRLATQKAEAILRERRYPGDKGPPPLILPKEFQTAEPEKPKADLPPAEKPKEAEAPKQDAPLVQQVATALSSKSCVRCHTGGGDTPVKGNVTLFTKKDGQLFFQPSVSKKTLLDAITPDPSTGTPAMPPDGTPLPAAIIDLLKKWESER